MPGNGYAILNGGKMYNKTMKGDEGQQHQEESSEAKNEKEVRQPRRLRHILQRVSPMVKKHFRTQWWIKCKPEESIFKKQKDLI